MTETNYNPPDPAEKSDNRTWLERISQRVAEQVARLSLKDADLHRKLKQVAGGLGLTAAGLTLLYTCSVGMGYPVETTRAKTPEPAAPTTIVTETNALPTEAPVISPTVTSTSTPAVESPASSVTVTEEVPTPEPAETQEPADFELSGTISEVGDNPNERLIKLQFPENLLDGENPLLPETTINFSFEINSEQPIEAVEIPMSSLLGPDFASFAPITFDATRLLFGQDILEHISQALAEQQYALSADAATRFSSIQLVITFSDVTGIHGTIPNNDVFYRTPDGMKKANPLKEFERSGIKIIHPSDSTADNAQHSPTIQAIYFTFNVGRDSTYLNSDDFTLQPVSSDAATAPEIPENSDPSSESAINWNQEWPENQTISFREWWDDMQSKGYIRVMDIAMHFRGEEINAMIDAIDMIPNPTGNSEQILLGSCEETLDRLTADYGEHIFIEPEAYENAPGGEKCQLVQRAQN